MRYGVALDTGSVNDIGLGPETLLGSSCIRIAQLQVEQADKLLLQAIRTERRKNTLFMDSEFGL